jgi:thymidylate synthase
MSTGFPLLTTKKMPFKLIATELMWFLRGDTNIKFLVDNNCHIWDGDAYKNYIFNSEWTPVSTSNGNIIGKKSDSDETMTQEIFINKIKTDDEFAKKWGDLGPIYGKQWRNWRGQDGYDWGTKVSETSIDQIQNLINDLKTNPDSRRLMVSAWNVGELDQMTLPPCHYGFQVYTRELSLKERRNIANSIQNDIHYGEFISPMAVEHWDRINIPTRAISLMWNQRSVDTFLGLPFNIASYGLLLEIVAKAVNMVPDELIGNLGDTHLYLNHVEQAKEQIGRELTYSERRTYRAKLVREGKIPFNGEVLEDDFKDLDKHNIPKRTRQPYPLPTLNINTEFWPTESGECGEGPIDAQVVFNNFTDEHFCKCLLEEDLQLGNYQSHPSIKAPLSN